MLSNSDLSAIEFIVNRLFYGNYLELITLKLAKAASGVLVSNYRALYRLN